VKKLGIWDASKQGLVFAQGFGPIDSRHRLIAGGGY